MTATRPRTVLVGCSFAGLEFLFRYVRRNGRFAPGEMTVVDPRDAQEYVPLVHEVAGGESQPSEMRFDAAAFCGAIGAEMVRGAVTRLDEARHIVALADGREFEYERLVLAVGSVPDVPDTLAKATNVIPAKFLESAEAIRRRLHVLRVGGASVQRVVVVGAGVTGVEWSAELAAARVDGARLATTLLCGSVRVLPTFPLSVARGAARALRALGVEILVSSRVSAVNAEQVILQGGIGIPFDVVVWATGVRPNPMTASLGLPLTEDGHVVVTPRLAVPGHEGIYAIGDCARVIDEGGRPWPTMERAIEAIWQGAYLARRFGSAWTPTEGPPHRLRRDFFYGISLGRKHGALVYKGIISVGRPQLWFRRFLQWAYYARF
ncbi:MAG TPA: FAD-dependent oxidoreductase, partial [Gemmatimonadaceae bacterium]|nr:FAD-dependent oxidoreductase [Gemmatimonadaceae bacterium]